MLLKEDKVPSMDSVKSHRLSQNLVKKIDCEKENSPWYCHETTSKRGPVKIQTVIFMCAQEGPSAIIILLDILKA